MNTLAYSPWGNGDSIAPFDQIFDNKVDAKKHGLSNADAFLLWGGQDIHSSFYNEKPNRYSQAGSYPSERDVWEWDAMKFCKSNNIPIIGVCRGAQFMCAFAGGKVIQHCTGHDTGAHDVMTIEGDVFEVSSAHHQMLDLHGTKHELLAWSAHKLSSVYYGEESVSAPYIAKQVEASEFREPEIVYFPEIRGLAIQGHPEWVNEDDIFVQVCNDLVVTRLFNKVWR